MRRVRTLCGAALVGSGIATAGEIDPGLEEVLQQTAPGETISTLVYLHDQLDADRITDELDAQGAGFHERHEAVVRMLREQAAATQGGLAAHLQDLEMQGRIASHAGRWVVNAFRVDATPAEIVPIANHPDVLRIYYNMPIGLIEPVESKLRPNNGVPNVGDGPTPGVAAIRPPEVWATGITGQGILVCTLDTGVDGGHPACASRWRGVSDSRYASNPEWAFFDPFTGWMFPQDSGTHGTHTMGTVCGGAPGEQIGVAPGAEWIHAAVIDRTGIGRMVDDAILAFQWMIDPDGNAGTSWDVPHVCSNSWGLLTSHGYPECAETFWVFLDAVEAAGTVILFSAGNEGTSGLRRPADRATDDYRSLAVAAVDANGAGPPWPIASFSSQGPTNCTPSGAAAIKPDISAPGVDVRSARPGGSYGNSSGTSMASPHVNGVVALMREVNPDLSVEEVKQIIYDTAVDLGTQGEDSTFGWGMIDAVEAVNAVLATSTMLIRFPNGRPASLDPNGGTSVRVEVRAGGVSPLPGTGMLHYDDGTGLVSVPMTAVSANVYDAVFPGFDCAIDVAYHVSVEGDDGRTFTRPFSAPQSQYFATVGYTGSVVHASDDFETHTGWTVVSDPSLTSGAWERGVPVNGHRGDPPSDYDGSGQCYVTQNVAGDSDVDGGPTILTSPAYDLSATLDADISVAVWYDNTIPPDDPFTVELSDDDGASWVLAETLGDGGGWRVRSYRVSEFVATTAQVRIRFSATDNPNNSLTEAGIDALEIRSLLCQPSNPADVNGDGVVNVLDLLAVLAAWGPRAGCPEDINGDGIVNVLDLLEVLDNWG